MKETELLTPDDLKIKEEIARRSMERVDEQEIWDQRHYQIEVEKWGRKFKAFQKFILKEYYGNYDFYRFVYNREKGNKSCMICGQELPLQKTMWVHRREGCVRIG
jgi:hypothetical protein